jgi:prepilin-type N-terminal cleavage/methylation domain-containing protein
MKRFALQDGLSLIELLIVVSVLAISGAVVFGPGIVKSSSTAKDVALPGLLDRALSTSQDYYAGTGNPTGAGTMDAFATNAAQLDSRITWAVPTTPQRNAAPSTLAVSTVYIASAAGADVSLCSASAKVVLCARDVGGVRTWAASSSSMSSALALSPGCVSAGKALGSRNSGC